jgi:hypothetical protein
MIFSVDRKYRNKIAPVYQAMYDKWFLFKESA